MKILVISQHWYPEDGVPQKRWTWLSGMLAGQGYKIQVIAPIRSQIPTKDGVGFNQNCSSQAIQDNEIGEAGETIFRSKYFGESNTLVRKAINQGLAALGILVKCLYLKRENQDFVPDIVVGSVPAIPIMLVTPLVALVLRTPYVIDLRDPWPELLRESKRWNSDTGESLFKARFLVSKGMRFMSFVLSKVMFQCLRSSSGIMVTSKFLERDLRNRFANHAKAPKIVTLRNVFPTTPVDRRRGRGESSSFNELNVLYAGTIGRAQKLSNAVEAAKIAGEQGGKVNLRLVGGGAAKEYLKGLTKNLNGVVEILDPVESKELESFYQWADTALVHLTDWQGLERAVPSKTYELMEIGIHITGVVRGESAELIEQLQAGDVVPPESPQELAKLWVELAKDKSRLEVPSIARDWVNIQRDQVSLTELKEFLKELNLVNET